MSKDRNPDDGDIEWALRGDPGIRTRQRLNEVWMVGKLGRVGCLEREGPIFLL
jgi:hypothetical protein